MNQPHIESLQLMANRLRRHSLLSTTESRSGHPSTCFSCAELVSAIFFHFLEFDLENPKSPTNDRFVLSKGHAAPILWAALAEGGAFPVEEVLNLRKIDSDLEGHPTPRSRFVDVGTGSLGQGLANAVGMAFASRLRRVDNRIFVLMGDGETAEGSVWEAAALAAHNKLDSLIAIVDVNRLGQSEATMYGHDTDVYVQRFNAFGWKTEVIDGHDLSQIIPALQRATENKGAPSAIIAKTLKGKGVDFMQDVDGWHGKPVTDPKQVEEALAQIGEINPLPQPLKIKAPSGRKAVSTGTKPLAAPAFSLGDKIATREAYGSGLTRLGHSDGDVVALDGDCKNSTFSLKFREAFPDRFVECFIAEQVMVGAAAGLASMGFTAFASSFACFLTRAYDFIRMSAISQVDLKLCGSHAGVSIGEDGPSQMALEDLAMMRAVAGSTVLYPSDAVSAEKLVALAAKTPGIVYIRTSRPKTPVIYGNDEEFVAGGSKVVCSSSKDRATVVGAGVTLHEAIKASEILKKEGIAIRVIDLYSVKPVDQATIQKAAAETGLIITVEDHFGEGGIGEAVRSALDSTSVRFRSVAVSGLARSGKPEELLAMFGIDAASIAATVKAELGV